MFVLHMFVLNQQMELALRYFAKDNKIYVIYVPKRIHRIDQVNMVI